MSSNGSATANPPVWAPWRDWLRWSPFKIDALGLITLLGAEEINGSVGRLVRSRYLEYLPLLGAYVVAGNRFRNKDPGFNLYNITQGIHTTDLSAWLTRWIRSHEFTSTRSFIRWTVVPPKPKLLRFLDDMLAISIGICLVGFLFAMTILQYDWYGMASTAAMGVSVFVRWYLVKSNREAIDDRVSKMSGEYNNDGVFTGYVVDRQHTYETLKMEWEKHQLKHSTSKSDVEAADGITKQRHRLECGWNGERPVKVLVVTSESQAITMMIPKEIIGSNSPFTANQEPPHRFQYASMRWIGWVAFVVQVITIGQADLATQIFTVALLVIPTIMYVGKFGCEDSSWAPNTRDFFRMILRRPSAPRDDSKFQHHRSCRIGSRLQAEIYDWPRSHDFKDSEGELVEFHKYGPRSDRKKARRQHQYAWLQLNEDEGRSMDKWDLFPHLKSDNNEWILRYEKMRDKIGELDGSVACINKVMVKRNDKDVLDGRIDGTPKSTETSETSSEARLGSNSAPSDDDQDQAPDAVIAQLPPISSEARTTGTLVHFANTPGLDYPRRTDTGLSAATVPGSHATPVRGGLRRRRASLPSVSDRDGTFVINPASWYTSHVELQQRDQLRHEDSQEVNTVDDTQA